MNHSTALNRAGKPRPAPLFNDVPDQLRRVILAFDAAELAPPSAKQEPLERLSQLIRGMGRGLDYDRACGGQVDWTPDHEAANAVWTAWMRCLMNGSGFDDEQFDELRAAIDAAKCVNKPT